jgi:hypothetical protein
MTTEEKILKIFELYKVQVFDEYGTPSNVIKTRYWNKIAKEIASLFEGYYEKETEVKNPIDMNGEINKKVSYCFHCGTNVHKQKYCHGCGYKLNWQKEVRK